MRKEKARKKKLFARRATIVGFGVLLVILIGAGLWAAINGIVGSLKQEETVAPTVAPTEAKTFTFNAPEIADDKKVEGYSKEEVSVIRRWKTLYRILC